MTDRAALFANVLNAPADDTARLVLADWLEEHDEEALGRFIRAGVVASHFRGVELISDPEYYEALRTLSDVTTAGEPARWLAALGIGPPPPPGPGWAWDNEGDRVTVRIGATSGVFTRGLLSELILPLQDWYDHASQALAAWPLERATITNVPGLTFWIDAPNNDSPEWKVTVAFTVQPRRRARRGVFARLESLLGGENPPPSPVPVGRWTAERTFPDRATLVRLSHDVWPVLFDEVRHAAGATGLVEFRPT